MNELVDEYAPKIHKILKKEGKALTKQIETLLEKMDFQKANDKNEQLYVNMADLVLNSLDQSAWDEQLAKAINSMTYNIYIEGMEDATTQMNGTFIADPVYHQFATDYSQDRTAELVGKRVLEDGTIIDNPNPEFSISESTRNMLRSDLVSSMEEGLTPAEIAKNLEGNYAFSESRSKMIARTETGFSWNAGAIKMYSHSGVKLLYVHDGDGDQDCIAANGQIWTADYASGRMLEHPNCVRSFAPCLDPSAEPDEY